VNITLNHGLNDQTTPQFLDLFAGPYLDNQSILFHGLVLPRCQSGTELYFNVPTSVKVHEGSGVYDFDIGSGLCFLKQKKKKK